MTRSDTATMIPPLLADPIDPTLALVAPTRLTQAAEALLGPEDISDDYVPEPVTAATRVATLLAVTIPLLGFVAGIWLHLRWGFGWGPLVALAVMYAVTGFGITIGYHRYFTHKSFETSRIMQILLAVFGSMAVEGPVIRWSAMHRCHHKHSDHAGDPHSPHHHGGGVMGVIRGLWHAHVGWIFLPDPRDLTRFIPDLMADRALVWISKLFGFWVLLGLVLPAVVMGLITRSWQGVLLGFLWGGLARVFLVHHATWSINSVCHVWGARPFKSHDESRNNVIFGIVGLGEGWHNNHHAFPASARHGLEWWQVDVSYYLIKLGEKIGLTWDVRTPSEHSLQMRRAH